MIGGTGMKRIIAGKKHFLFGLCIILFLLSMLSVVTKASDNIYPTEKREWVELVDITITAPDIGRNPVFDSKMDPYTMRSQGYGFEVSEWKEKSGNQSRYLTVL